MFSVSGAVGEGLVTNLGGALINTNHHDMLALADELGVDLFNRVEHRAGSPFPATRYFFEGRMIPETELADALRPLAAQITLDADRAPSLAATWRVQHRGLDRPGGGPPRLGRHPEPDRPRGRCTHLLFWR